MSHPFLRYLSGYLNIKIISCKEKVRTLIALGSYYIVWCGKRDFESDIRYAKSIEFAYANLARNLACGETGSAKSVPAQTKQKEGDLLVCRIYRGNGTLNRIFATRNPSSLLMQTSPVISPMARRVLRNPSPHQQNKKRST